MSGCFSNTKCSENINQEIIDKTKTHPCYSEFAHKYARMHIPVAPKCNISCNYCNRKHDCLHEARPGVTSEVLTPEEATEKYLAVKEKLDNLKVVGIAGPGDALANFEQTKESIQLIKAESSENTTFCISTNGLMLPHYAEKIVELGINHVTITINTIDPTIGAKIYDQVNYQGETLIGEEGAEILLNNQLEGLEYLASQGVLCKVNIVMIKGLNDNHIEKVVKRVKKLGAFMTNIMPLIPAEGSKFEDMPLVSNTELNKLREKCSLYLKQMYHCKQCRADAIGMLSQDQSIEFRSNGCGKDKGQLIEEEEANMGQEEVLFAVASKTDRLIDQHFGHVEEFLIYKYTDEEVELVDKRSVEQYCTGKECADKEIKIEKISNLLHDCSAVLCIRIGLEPKKKLEQRGIQIIEVYDRIEDGIKYAVEQLELKDIG
ncbi:hypothetical protein JCM16358_06120 [Halanaerocella petrolearia]